MTLEDLTTHPGPKGIGSFDACDTSPADELMDADDRRAVIRIFGKLSEDEADALRRHIEVEKFEAIKDVQQRVFALVARVLRFVFPTSGRFEVANLWGVVYALDDEQYHCNIEPTEKARQLGLTRQAISHSIRLAGQLFNMTGRNASRWMRSDETAAKSSKARNEFCAGDPQKNKRTDPKN